VDDLKANTEYSGYSIASPVIQWFWEIVQGFSKEDKARFLQFVTGTSKVFAESTYYFLNFKAIVFICKLYLFGRLDDYLYFSQYLYYLSRN
jgi:hypothetical protein